MKNDRFLLALLAGTALLAAAVFSLYFILMGNTPYAADDRPENIVHNYELALQQADYEKAFGFLVETEGKPDLQAFRLTFQADYLSSSRTRLELGIPVVTGDTCLIPFNAVSRGSGLFATNTRISGEAHLVRVSGRWQLAYLPYPYWGFDWYGGKTAPYPPYP
jgi:hypothetical protein